MPDFQATVTFNSCREGTETMNGTATMAFSGTVDNPVSLTFSSSNLSYADTVTDDNISMTNFSMVITGDDLTGATITLTGVVSGTVSGDPINEELDSFQIVLSSDTTGETMSISGMVKASCLGEWVTITTNTPVFVSTGDDCPIDGEFTITSGGNSVKVVIESDSKITVLFNNSPVQTYNNCEEVDGLCAV